MTPTETALRCSFCGKADQAIAKLIAGPGVYICNECVDTCNEILAEDRRSPADQPRLPDWAGMSDEDLLAHLPRVAQVGEQVETSLRQWVLRARERGITWSRIGDALQMTRQSAWGRFSGEE